MKITIRRHGPDAFRPDIFVKLPNGKRVRERPVIRNMTKTAVREWASARAAELIAKYQEPGDRKPAPTLSAFETTFIAHLEGRRRKESTIYAVKSILRKHLVPLLGSMRLDAIGPIEIDDLHKRLRSKAPKTARNIVSTLAKLLRVAKHLDVIEKLPVESFDLPKIEHDAVPPFFTFAEYKALRVGAAKHDARTLVAVLLGADAGLRAGEIVGLEWPDVGRADGLITVNRQVWRSIVGSPKSGKGRTIPMTPRLAAALEAVRHLRGARVLVQDDGAPLTAKVLKRWLKSAQRLAGLEATGNAHVLRHTFCSHLAMRGAPAVTIKELAGHAHLSTTMRYMHLQAGAKEAAIGLLSESTPRPGAKLGVATECHADPEN